MSTALISFTSGQLDLIKRTIAKGASDDELKMFMAHCNRTGLDPFAKQIYCIARKAKDDQGNWVSKMETQVSIDGLRLIAERTERYVPGRESSYKYDDKGNLISATAYVKKLAGGVWHEVSATAFYFEYVQLKRDGNPNQFWATKPHVMLAKCAEALALRRAFPHEMGGLYTDDEIPEVEVVESNTPKRIENKATSAPAPVAAPPERAANAKDANPVVLLTPEEDEKLREWIGESGVSVVALCKRFGVLTMAEMQSKWFVPAVDLCKIAMSLSGREFDAAEFWTLAEAKSLWEIPGKNLRKCVGFMGSQPLRQTQPEPQPQQDDEPAYTM